MTRRKWKTLLATTLAAALLLTACGGGKGATQAPTNTPTEGGSIQVAVPFSPTTLDGDTVTAQDVNNMMNHVYESLFEFNADYEPTPMLATGYTMADDNRTYVIQLREDVVFHNGKAMTSADVVASLNRWFHLNGTGKNVAKQLVSCVADGDYAVRVTFNAPYAPFVSFLAANVSNSKCFIRPAEVCAAYPDSAVQDYTGTGPYQVDAFVPDQNLVLKKFADYKAATGEASGLAGKRVAYADEVVFNFVSEQSVRIAGVQSGQYQFAQGVPSDQYSTLQGDQKVQTYIVKPSAQLLLILNQGGELLQDVRLRQALVYGINNEQIAEVAIGNPDFWSLNGCLFPPGTQWFDDTAGQGMYNKKDSEKAKALMQEAGYTDKPIVILAQKENPVYAQAAIGLQSQLEALGFKVDLQLSDNATVLEKRAQKEGWDILVNMFLQPDPDPQVYGGWMGTDKWIGNWNDDRSRQMDAIFDRMVSATDEKARYDIVKEWYAYFYDTVPYVKIVDFAALYIASDALGGYANFSTPYYWNTWVASK